MTPNADNRLSVWLKRWNKNQSCPYRILRAELLRAVGLGQQRCCQPESRAPTLHLDRSAAVCSARPVRISAGRSKAIARSSTAA